jgi:hypothetical protein
MPDSLASDSGAGGGGGRMHLASVAVDEEREREIERQERESLLIGTQFSNLYTGQGQEFLDLTSYADPSPPPQPFAQGLY